MTFEKTKAEHEEESQKQVFPNDTLMIFNGSEFFTYDFAKPKWDLGDMGGSGALVYDNCSLVSLDPTVQKNEFLGFSLISTGGYYNGNISNGCIGIRFLQEERNGINTLIGDNREILTNLSVPRFLHQSIVIF
jgi:hypothetical protein